MTRRRGSVREPIGIGAGDHICWSYSTDEEHRTVLTAYLVEGLLGGDRIGYFGSRDQQERVARYLCDAGYDADALGRNGRVVFGDASEAYMPGGELNPAARVDGFRAAAEAAKQEGFRGIRVAADVAQMLRDERFASVWPSYELRADMLIARAPITGMCCYDLRECSMDTVLLVESLHALGLHPNGIEPLVRVTGEVDGGLAVGGELDYFHASELKDALVSAVAATETPTIHLCDLRFIDVAGIRLIAGAVRELEARGDEVELRGASPGFRRLWQLLALDRATQARFN